ncbi:MAG: retroviral-like aspartic protease family protein [Novosphingobium sp.]|nr:retroviral-like aspartic protease family protein [Novosphingobium sp.]
MGPGPAIALALSSAAFPASHAASGAQDASGTDVIAGDADRADRLTVPVHIGSAGPFRFLLDTGAQNTVIATSLAHELALPAGLPAVIVGVAGRHPVETVEIEEILLGRRNAYALRAPLLDRTDIGADGILGLDSLRGNRVLLDFRRNLIAVSDAKSLGGDSGYEIVVRARSREGQLIVTNAEIDGVRASVVIDTGAQASIGNRALQRALARRQRLDQTVITSVTGQQVTADMGMARMLAFDDLNIQNISIAYADAPAFAHLGLDQRPALLLGMRELRAFRRVAIDFATRKVLFDL